MNPADLRLDFCIPLWRYPRESDLDEPAHAASLAGSDRERANRLRPLVARGSRPRPETSTQHETTPASAGARSFVAVSTETQVQPPAQDSTPIRNVYLNRPAARPPAYVYAYCSPRRFRLGIPDPKGVQVPCLPPGKSLCWMIFAEPEKVPPGEFGDQYRMLLDLASPNSFLYHEDCVIRSPFPAEDPWPSNPDMHPGEYATHKSGPPRYVRDEELDLTLINPELYEAVPKSSKYWTAYADRSKYLVQPYGFKKFYFPGFSRNTGEAPKVDIEDRRHAEIEDASIELNLAVNEAGLQTDMKNDVEGLMGLAIPKRGSGSFVERLCYFDGNEAPAFVLYLHKKRQSYLILNPSVPYLHTISSQWSNRIHVDSSLLSNHWFIRMQSISFSNEEFQLPKGSMSPLVELDTASTYCYLHRKIFLPLSKKANMVYNIDEDLHYLPVDYIKNCTPLRITIATTGRPYTLEVPLGPSGPVRAIGGEPYVTSYFQLQTLGEEEEEEEEEEEFGCAGSVFGSAFFYYYYIYFALQKEPGGQTDQVHPTIRISALRKPSLDAEPE